MIFTSASFAGQTISGAASMEVEANQAFRRERITIFCALRTFSRQLFAFVENDYFC
jgi:hypothetical protein